MGNPAGGLSVLSVRNGCVWSMPVSSTPILMPAPAFATPPTAVQAAGALMTPTERFMVGAKVRLGSTDVTPGPARSESKLAPFSWIPKPLRTVSYSRSN